MMLALWAWRFERGSSVATVVHTDAPNSQHAESTLERVLWASAVVAAGISVLGWWNPQGWKLLDVAVGYPALWIAAAFVLLLVRAPFLVVVFGAALVAALARALG